MGCPNNAPRQPAQRSVVAKPKRFVLFQAAARQQFLIRYKKTLAHNQRFLPFSFRRASAAPHPR